MRRTGARRTANTHGGGNGSRQRGLAKHYTASASSKWIAAPLVQPTPGPSPLRESFIAPVDQSADVIDTTTTSDAATTDASGNAAEPSAKSVQSTTGTTATSHTAMAGPSDALGSPIMPVDDVFDFSSKEFVFDIPAAFAGSIYTTAEPIAAVNDQDPTSAVDQCSDLSKAAADPGLQSTFNIAAEPSHSVLGASTVLVSTTIASGNPAQNNANSNATGSLDSASMNLKVTMPQGGAASTKHSEQTLPAQTEDKVATSHNSHDVAGMPTPPRPGTPRPARVDLSQMSVYPGASESANSLDSIKGDSAVRNVTWSQAATSNKVSTPMVSVAGSGPTGIPTSNGSAAASSAAESSAQQSLGAKTAVTKIDEKANSSQSPVAAQMPNPRSSTVSQVPPIGSGAARMPPSSVSASTQMHYGGNRAAAQMLPPPVPPTRLMPSPQFHSVAQMRPPQSLAATQIHPPRTTPSAQTPPSNNPGSAQMVSSSNAITTQTSLPENPLVWGTSPPRVDANLQTRLPSTNFAAAVTPPYNPTTGRALPANSFVTVAQTPPADSRAPTQVPPSNQISTGPMLPPPGSVVAQVPPANNSTRTQATLPTPAAPAQAATAPTPNNGGANNQVVDIDMTDLNDIDDEMDDLDADAAGDMQVDGPSATTFVQGTSAIPQNVAPSTDVHMTQSLPATSTVQAPALTQMSGNQPGIIPNAPSSSGPLLRTPSLQMSLGTQTTRNTGFVPSTSTGVLSTPLLPAFEPKSSEGGSSEGVLKDALLNMSRGATLETRNPSSASNGPSKSPSNGIFASSSGSATTSTAGDGPVQAATTTASATMQVPGNNSFQNIPPAAPAVSTTKSLATNNLSQAATATPSTTLKVTPITPAKSACTSTPSANTSQPASLSLGDLAKPQSAQQPTSSPSKPAQPKQSATPLITTISEPPRLRPTPDYFHARLWECARSIRNEPFCFGYSPPQRRVMPPRGSVPRYRLKHSGPLHKPGEMERKILGPGGLPPLPMPTPMPALKPPRERQVYTSSLGVSDDLLRLRHEVMRSGSYGYASSTGYSRSHSTGRDWVEPSIPLNSFVDDQPPPAPPVDQSQQPAPTDEHSEEACEEAEPYPPPKPRISRSRSNSLDLDERTAALASSPELMRMLAEMTPESTGFAEEQEPDYDEDEDEEEEEEEEKQEEPWRAQERERLHEHRRAQRERQKAAVRRRKWRESRTCGLGEAASEAATVALDAALAGAGHVPGLAVRAAGLGVVGAGYVVDVTFRAAVVGSGYSGYVLGVVVDVVSREAKALYDRWA